MRPFWEKPEVLEGTPKAFDPPASPPASDEIYSDNSGKFLINKSGLELVKHFESFFQKAYRDPVGVVTIGYGRIIYPSGKRVQMGDACTREEATRWLLEDLYSEGAKYVRAFLTNEESLNENEFSALVSFTFNRGAGRFREEIAGFLNKGDKDRAMKSLLSYTWAGSGHKYLAGLDRRRRAERALFVGKDWTVFKDMENWKKYA